MRRPLAGLALLACAACSRGVNNYADTPGPRFAGSPSAAPELAEGSELKVVTWNVEWGEAPAAAAHALATNPALRDADLVLLQEMNETAVSIIASRLGAGYVYYPATLHPQKERHFGNAIVSRWPLVEDRKLVLPRVALLMRTARAAVVATALVRGHRIRVYSLHLATPFEVGHGGIEDQLRAVIRDAAASPDPVVIGGDLNSSTVGRLLVAGGYRWLTSRVGPTAWVFPLDHVFVRGLGESAADAGSVEDDDLPSNHRPVWTVIPLDGSPALQR